MAIRAVIFDIGGVLEVTTPTGWEQRWASRLGLSVAEMGGLLEPAFRGGGTGEVTLPEVELRVAAALGLGDTEACVVGARGAGMRAVLFTSSEQAIADVESCLGRPPVSPPRGS